MPYEPPAYSKTTPGKRKQILFGILLMIVVVAALVVGLNIGLSGNNDNNGNETRDNPLTTVAPTGSPTASPTVSSAPTAEPNRFPEVVDFLVQQGISSEIDVKTEGTPQNLAAHWIADGDVHLASFGDDNYQVGVVNRAYQFVTRYSLAVFFFSTNGPTSWIEPYYF